MKVYRYIYICKYTVDTTSTNQFLNDHSNNILLFRFLSMNGKNSNGIKTKSPRKLNVENINATHRCEEMNEIYYILS